MINWETYKYIHDILLFLIYLGFNICIVHVLYLLIGQHKIAKSKNLLLLDQVYKGVLTVNVILLIRTIILMFSSGDYYYFQNTFLRKFLSQHINFILYCIVLSECLLFFYLLRQLS